MSIYKRTVVPGMNINQEGGENFQGYQPDNFSNNGTYVPGMRDHGSSVLHSEENTRNAGEPIVGFLYSISKGFPEYWPIKLGLNTIGRNSSNDIVLNEQTVSSQHASLLVQKTRNTGEVLSVLRIEAARNPILINGNDIDLKFGTECHNGDIISIGEHYIMHITLINAEAVGLSVDPDFIASEREENISDFGSPTRSTFNPYDHSKRATVSLDGGVEEEPGGTRFM